jgi:hypothetical protein
MSEKLVFRPRSQETCKPQPWTWILEDEEAAMEDKEKREEDQVEKKPEEKLPFCTSAPSAEHARGSEEEEPCNDYRGGP